VPNGTYVLQNKDSLEKKETKDSTILPALFVFVAQVQLQA
jgi:hypothetical protein